MPDPPVFDKDGMASPLISPLPAVPEARHYGMDNFADTLSRIDRHARLARAQHRGVRVGSFGFALEPTALFEIMESAKLSPLPGVTSLCKGLANHRGNVVPVYDLAELTDTIPTAWERKRLLILGSKENAVGLFLYDLPTQIGTGNRVELHEVTDVPDIFCRHASGAYLNNDRFWLILDRESFFTELNRLCLQFE